MKHCNKCNQTLQVKDFWKDSTKPDGLRHFCKSCSKKAKAIKYKENRNKVLAYHASVRLKNREKIRKSQWLSRLKLNFGMSEIEYNDKLMEQNGCCAICKSSTPGGNAEIFSVDHCHVTVIS